MMRRRNPLLARPPVPPRRKAHRAGAAINRRIAAHLGTSFDIPFTKRPGPAARPKKVRKARKRRRASQ